MTNNLIRLEITIPTEMLEDILDTAFGGGINYWAKLCSINEDITEYTISDVEDPSIQWDITNDTIQKGINLILTDPEFQIAPRIKEYILNGVLEKDSGHIDAEAADCIVQAGLFNEIVFG